MPVKILGKMAKLKYSVKITELKEVHEIPGAWTHKDFLGILEHVEYAGAGDIPQEELKDMACLALSDFEIEEAAVKVLEYRLGDQLNKGQRQNLATELQEDKLWEEYSDLTLHEELFNVGCILYWAFPRNFPEPDIARLQIQITAANAESKVNLEQLTASFLTRILNGGMDENNIMNRLFDENLTGNSFPEAEHILWKYESTPYDSATQVCTVTIYTSWNWVEDLKGVSDYEAVAYADGQLD